MRTGIPLRWNLRSIVLGVSALILTWLVVSRSLTAYLADVAPQAALWLNPGQPVALLNLADRALRSPRTPVDGGSPDQASKHLDSVSNDAASVPHGAPPSPPSYKFTRNFDQAFKSYESIGPNQSISRPAPLDNAATVRLWAVTALKKDPINARALRILGQLAEADGDDVDTSKFMLAADRLSLHESAATFWLLRKSTQAKDFKSGVYYGDILLRNNPQSSRDVVPFLTQMSEDKAGADILKAALAADPPWLPQFVERLPYSVTDARTPLNLLLALRNGPEPPTAADIRPYISFLLGHRFYGLAYYTWLQFLPASDLRHAGLLFNGNFDGVPSGFPFDWQITQGSGVTIDIVPRSDKGDGHALLIDFQFGRVDYHSVTQLVMLAPGTYQFSGEYKGELVGPRGMKWRISCANADTPIGESQPINGARKGWTNVAFPFTVPNKDCVAQNVRLDLDARSASERLVSGSILFDSLQISRVVNPSTAGG